ncbi:Uncharacterized protein DBV15_04599 [Temnothorax longispinosus]|uniref:Uncharacterized protein n=1 Tax=Temnothorax longispinosus TaxID=300112 RepID=A0A4S2KWM2_9HYME|nr:Uncharacterized protein DBV15_04599 [Temnothorax longispinosus]
MKLNQHLLGCRNFFAGDTDVEQLRYKQYQLIVKAAWDLAEIDSLKFIAVAFKGERQATIGGRERQVSPIGKKWRGGGASTTWGNDRYVVRYSLDVDQSDGLRMSWQLRILPGRSKEAANRRNPLMPSIRRAGQ